MGLFADMVEKPAININRQIEEAPEGAPALPEEAEQPALQPEQAPVLFGLGHGRQRRAQLDEALGGGTPMGRSRFAQMVQPTQEADEMTPEGMSRLTLDEGERLKVYKDTKKIDTIGVGFNLEEPANRATFQRVTGFSVEEARAGRAITRAQSRALLEVTAKAAEQDARSLVPEYDQLPTVAQDALVNFVFNVGKTKASEFKNTLAAIRRGDGKAAADGLRKSAYYKQVGARGERVAQALERIGKPEATVVAPKPQDAASEPAGAPAATGAGVAAAGAGLIGARGASQAGNVAVFSDKGAVLKVEVKAGGPQKLADVLDHPELFKRYPDLASLPVTFEVPSEADRAKGVEGGLKMDKGKPVSITVNPLKGDAYSRLTLLHEVQHAMQALDGRQSGANPDDIRAIKQHAEEVLGSTRISAAQDAGVKLKKLLQQQKLWSDDPEDIINLQLANLQYGVVSTDVAQAVEILKADLETAGVEVNPKIYDAIGTIEMMLQSDQLMSPRELYLNAPGEVEAFGIEKLAGKTEEELRHLFGGTDITADKVLKVLRKLAR